MFAHVCCWMLLCMCPGGCVCFGLLLLHSLFGVPCLSCLALFLRARWSCYTCMCVCVCLISIDVQLAWACVGGHSISLRFCQKKLPVIQGTGYNHFCTPAETHYGHDDCIRSSAYLISFLSQAGEDRRGKGRRRWRKRLLLNFKITQPSSPQLADGETWQGGKKIIQLFALQFSPMSSCFYRCLQDHANVYSKFRLWLNVKLMLQEFQWIIESKIGRRWWRPPCRSTEGGKSGGWM